MTKISHLLLKSVIFVNSNGANEREMEVLVQLWSRLYAVTMTRLGVVEFRPNH